MLLPCVVGSKACRKPTVTVGSLTLSETCAPGITAPLASWTTPVIDPDAFCARSGTLHAIEPTMIKASIAANSLGFESIGVSSVVWRVVYMAAHYRRPRALL